MFYPPISDEQAWAFRVILESLKDDPGYLEGADCPYDAELKGLLGGRSVSVEAVVEAEEPEFDLLKATQDAWRDLQDQKSKLGVNAHSEAMSYFRVNAALLEKLVVLQERAQKLRDMDSFQRVVLSVMEDLLDAGGREEFMKRLKESEQ